MLTHINEMLDSVTRFSFQKKNLALDYAKVTHKSRVGLCPAFAFSIRHVSPFAPNERVCSSSLRLPS
ncbi:hypothetical protein L596_002210 [Steinernema carpocapsae]|uniref:Uncharacterized protein n=1 Tax=Steinernema carpocapsae TaxID=34508 RepID=A0A4U8UPL2_STECR|nr:hypothetical protein L596_002210 [Steinernema carpocapsae]